MNITNYSPHLLSSKEVAKLTEFLRERAGEPIKEATIFATGKIRAVTESGQFGVEYYLADVFPAKGGEK